VRKLIIAINRLNASSDSLWIAIEAA